MASSREIQEDERRMADELALIRERPDRLER